MWRKSKGAPLRDFFVFVQFLFQFWLSSNGVYGSWKICICGDFHWERPELRQICLPGASGTRPKRANSNWADFKKVDWPIARHPAPVAWPPRSPDLTPLDFWVWGHLKQQIFTQDFPPRTIDELKDAIRRAVAELNEDEEVRVRVFGEFRRRLDECVRRGGQSVERR